MVRTYASCDDDAIKAAAAKNTLTHASRPTPRHRTGRVQQVVERRAEVGTQPSRTAYRHSIGPGSARVEHACPSAGRPAVASRPALQGHACATRGANAPRVHQHPPRTWLGASACWHAGARGGRCCCLNGASATARGPAGCTGGSSTRALSHDAAGVRAAANKHAEKQAC
jgi:hypothetical protein